MPPQPLPPPPANGAELVVTAGESATIHVPTTDQAVVQIMASCKTSTDLRIEAPTNVVEDRATLAIGRHPYEIRCDGATAPTYAGTIELVADAGTGHVMDRAPRRGISLDGRTYTFSIEGAFPVIDLAVPATASQYRLDFERDGAPYMTLEGANPVFSLDATALKLGTYLVRTTLDGKLGSTTKLVIQVNPHAAVASIAEPVDGATWSSPVRVAGVAIPGAQVSVSGVGVVVGDEQQHRFVAELDVGGASTLAIRVQHPQLGLHYFLRRRALTVATAPSHGKPVIAILGLEPASSDRALVQVAKDLSEMLRARAKAGTGPYQLGPGTDKELVDEKLLNNCEAEAASCMAAVGTNLGADVMMFGHIEPQGDVYQVTIKLLDVRARTVLRTVTVPTPKAAAGTDIAVLGKQLYTKLTGDGSSSAPPACDADALREQGTEDEGLGRHAAALKAFEASLACKPDAHTVELALMASCNARDVAKARTFWKQMKPDRREKLVMVCTRSGITRDQLDAAATGTLALKSNPAAKVLIDGKDTGQTTPIRGMALAPGTHEVTFVAGTAKQTFEVSIEAGKTTTVSKQLDTPPPAQCDADALREQGTEAEGMGQHAQALKKFVQSLQCKRDEQTLALAFMASCNASNLASAKRFWKQLTPDRRNKLYQLCTRNHILREQLDGP